MIEAGTWIRRQEPRSGSGDWHEVEMMLKGDPVTTCGHWMRTITKAGVGLDVSGDPPEGERRCWKCCDA